MRAWFGPMLPEAEATYGAPGPAGMVPRVLFAARGTDPLR